MERRAFPPVGFKSMNALISNHKRLKKQCLPAPTSKITRYCDTLNSCYFPPGSII